MAVKEKAGEASPAAAPTMTVDELIERWFNDSFKNVQGLSSDHYARFHQAKEDLKKILKETA